ncbi:putative glycosyltransferase CsbB [Virgibacillus pantothenticus]|uniref:glycosyltransferase family 2 protein n=1 Tax=Virgibacillus TaxID=84406 RepID=UPI00090C67D8|nr:MULTISPECIES: glycosyltransferase family 2 protein [Virgibacillus]API93035.1 glycosyltransferase [Virgibacillus sp. 6R]MBS7429287.1 glycosyltransferase family 2 protein [Virgibacillus sp. 19R1-5]MBU8567100.1 glycosyltransferase family 2 protein [Virgibacillus pantothenticus]MBU8600868.1 glycosyltransferase family 2 protein [Virgibacillus pantothenticus]MBU8635252.1 glycosyltransferase family 2 protein [Virgibacillus pantothenticus]
MELISIIIPTYNEEDNIQLIYESVKREFDRLAYHFEMIFIDDASTDNTLQQIKQLVSKSTNVRYISFSRNFGKESAMLAGLQHVQGEAVIIMDADLQHPPSLIPDLVKGWEDGYDQVIARRNRSGEKPIRKFLSSAYYRIINKVVDVKLEDGVGDFRLLSRRAVHAVLSLDEGARFSKGLFSWIGMAQKIVDYENVPRKNGKTKWSLLKLLNYGLDGVVSFNNRPLRICFYTGALILLLSIIYSIIIFVQILLNGIKVPGYFTIITAVLILGGIQLLSLGVIGEYIGRIYYETKKRPQYLIQETNIRNGENYERNRSRISKIYHHRRSQHY